MSWRTDVHAALGRRGTALAGAAIVAGAAAFASGLGGGRAPGTFGTLIASWLFFAGGALGAVTFGALFRIVPARWARSLVALGQAPAVFAPVALVVLVVILAGAAERSLGRRKPRLAGLSAVGGKGDCALHRPLPRGAALVRPARPARGAVLPSAVTFLIAYTVVLSIWAWDFVLGPDPVFGSTVIGPFVFVATFLAGTDLLVLLALARGDLLRGRSTRRRSRSCSR